MKSTSLMSRQKSAWRLLLLAIIVVSGLGVFTSCGDDDDKTNAIDYYFEVEEQFLVNGSKDRTTMYQNPIPLMQDAIKKAYPTPNPQGNDQAVLAACDQAYKDYVSLYEDLNDDNLTALIHLKRAVRINGLIKESVNLKTYHFIINPHEEEIVE